MRPSRHVALIIASLLGAGLGACGKGDPVDGQAAGIGSSKQGIMAVWKRLAAYDSVYLKAWKGALADPDPSPRDVLDAFNELGFAITGPAGFWRKTVPNQWFGCEAAPDTLVCKTLADASSGELKSWDAFQNDIAAVAEGQETAFLAKNQARMLTYLDTFVPDHPSMSAMKETVFFKTKLEKTLGVTATTGNDL